jgi:hypothetical protein
VSTRVSTPATTRRLATLAVIAAAPMLASCDPCSGVIGGCTVERQVSYEGSVVEFKTGHGVPGVRVAFRRVSGATLLGDSLTGTSDAEGRYRLAGAVAGEGDVIGDLRVTPPAPLPAYDVGGVKLIPTHTRGGGDLLYTLLVQPQIDFIGELRYSRSGGALAYASMRFIRTSGARLAGGDTILAASGADGYFYITAPVLEIGEVVGNLDLAAPGFPRDYTITGFRMPVRVHARIPSLDRTTIVGSNLDYVGELRDRTTRLPIAGATVEFRRVSGPRLATETFTTQSNAEGRFALAPQPVDEQAGTVVADLTVSGGGLARPFVIRGVRLAVYDDDQLRFLGVLGVGFQAVAAGEVVFRGDRTPLAGADVRFVRTGGLAASPESLLTRSASDGRFGVSLNTDAAGEVVGNLVVTRAGAAPVTFPGVRLVASGDDSVRFAGRFAVGQHIQYAGQLVRRADGGGAAGWTVTFRRTAGIALVRDTVSSVSVDWGGFAIAPDTRAEGSVEGTLTARAPGSTTDVPLGSIRLSTFDSDSVRFAGRYRVGPSLLYVGELLRDDTGRPIADARIEFRRTSGIATAESVLVARSDAVGRFRLAPTPLADGEVIGDLRVFPPAPLRDTVFTNVRLTTFESDEVRLRDVWRLAPPQ